MKTIKKTKPGRPKDLPGFVVSQTHREAKRRKPNASLKKTLHGTRLKRKSLGFPRLLSNAKQPLNCGREPHFVLNQRGILMLAEILKKANTKFNK